MNDLSYLKTLAYFDIFSFPLTESELHAWQWISDDKVNVKVEMKNSKGFNFLSGREHILIERQTRYIDSVLKLRRARKVAKILSIFPSVKMIAVCNSLGFLNARQSSDIDFFILTDPGKIWLTRFWLQGILKIFRLRPYDKNGKKDSICLTFFLSTDNLDISTWQVAPTDIYLAYWITQLLPIYNPESWYENFFHANDWIKKYIPNFKELKLAPAWQIHKSKYTKFLFIFSLLGWEKILKKIQLYILPASLRAIANQDTRVVIKDNMLKFHGQEDKRKDYLNLWQKKIGLKN
jgi:hypothetical protein